MVKFRFGSSSTRVFSASISFRRGGYTGGRTRRHDHREATAGARPAGHFNTPAVLLHDLLDDGQPDSGTGLPRFFRPLGAVELLEDLLHFLLVHADPLILDRHMDPGIVLPGGGGYLGALG